jgi:hypothetical protein
MVVVEAESVASRTLSFAMVGSLLWYHLLWRK